MKSESKESKIRRIDNLLAKIEADEDVVLETADCAEVYHLLKELKASLKKGKRKSSADDWRGCQGTCDFEPQPNLTGWI